eukprot:TRINITY_DN18643_c0_g1_i1.p1 TRINITY_DN18643_c0_g1~~TRINITY_DN18643_c0_g1_i1.p1  ORF type:complete len:144 (-),score=14.73 TRINITY_DN18643_c0_g1_i1:5-436(-)
MRHCFLGLLVLIPLVLGTMDVYTKIAAGQAEGWATKNGTQILDSFAYNALFVVPGFRWDGIEEIEDMVASSFKMEHNVKVDISSVFGSGGKAAVQWTWSACVENVHKRYIEDDAIIFHLDEQDKIVYWREYFNESPKNFIGPC